LIYNNNNLFFFKKKGFIAIVLPLACIDNSRYFDEPTLHAMLAQLAFAPRTVHRSPKLYFALYQREPGSAAPHVDVRKRTLRAGQRRNNFHIELIW
jgi:25S rRNA (adenine2142-N1)-methyltransferase